MLRLPLDIHLELVAESIRGLPEEVCGLIAGDPASGEVVSWYPTENVAHSARLYSVNPLEHLKADRDAEAHGLQIIGVFHSHTHTDAYPSPTDISQAPDPGWHYLLVSLRDNRPVLRSYRIVDGDVEEESVIVRKRWAQAS
jgi:[CysO sulfur-carrier protein]-S-L-cysteine hydrolase